jgi:hypothetical protein
MNWPGSWVTIVWLTILRLVLPLALTIAAVYVLRKLDEHWQADAQRNARRVSALAAATTPCWQARNCSPAQRANCRAYQLREQMRCWQAFRQVEGRMPERCFNCEVFLAA